MAIQKQTQEIVFEEVVERRCGLDVHKKEIVATVSGMGIESQTRTFQSTTRSLTELKEWLLALGVNARRIKYVPGHKTDKKDSAWICKMLRAGLLKSCFALGRSQREQLAETGVDIGLLFLGQTAQETTRIELVRDTKLIGRTKPKADFY